jgi:hypothetical protein
LHGHFELELGAHFKLEWGGQYSWNLQLARMEAASFFMLFSSIKKIQRTAG